MNAPLVRLLLTVRIRLCFTFAMVVCMGFVRMSVSVTVSLIMVTGLEELARVFPALLFAGRREHGGNGKEGGDDSGLHVGW